MAQASMAKFHHLQKKLETAQKRVSKIKEMADDKVQHVVRSTEVGASALVLGVVMGKYGAKAETIAGIPTGLATAAVLHGMGLFGVGGDMASHLHAFGDGALATFASGFGKQIGAASAAGLPAGEAIRRAMNPGTVTAQGALYGNVAGQRLTDSELDALKKA
jgi:hypothetical protein